MDPNSKTEKTSTQTGFLPMELAESNENRHNTAEIRECLQAFLKCVSCILFLIVIALASQFLFQHLFSNSSSSQRNTEIFVVSSKQSDIETYLSMYNKTLLNPRRKKRNIVPKTITTKNLDKRNIDLNDEQIQKSRKVIMSHDALCNKENKNEVCKDLVMKINAEINKAPDADNLVDSSTGDPNSVKNVVKDSDNLEPTVITKRDTYATTNTHTFHSTSNMPNVEKDRSAYEYTDSSSGLYHTYHQAAPPPLTETCLLARLLKQTYPNLQGVYGVLPSEHVASHQEYNRYLASPLNSPYTEDREVEARRRKIHPQDLDIYLNIMMPKQSLEVEHFSNSSAREVECIDGSISCASGGICIKEKQWCDGKVDCPDVSDEMACNCKFRVDKSRLCDGYSDCPFGEDEMGCHGCNDNTFSCEDFDINSQSTCFTKDQRCNNIPDCPNRKDELECNMLAPTLHNNPLFAISNTDGFLQRNYKGDWYVVCRSPYMWAHEACRRETGLVIRPPYIQFLQIDPLLKVRYLNTGPDGLTHVSDTCFNSSAVYVTCHDLLCGTRVLTTSQLLKESAGFEGHLFGRNKRYLVKYPYQRMLYRHRIKRSISYTADTKDSHEVVNPRPTSIHFDNRNKRTESRVVGGRPSQPAAWPWMVAMYRDGMFHCGGVILNQHWIMSAAHCVHKFWEHYFEIQVGMLRRFSFSPQEQNHLVTHVIVNQKYDRIDMKNDLSLLRVRSSIQFSRWVRPICLPGPDTAGPDWMWGPAPGSMCTAVGWGATIEHGPDPDHLREVEVPIWTNCKHKEDRAGREICAGLVEGGKDACQGDSGGPLLCRNPLNSQQWFMAGIVSHGDGCARKDEPGVYTRVSLFVKWIKYHIMSKSLPTIQPKQECPGFKCISGIPKCLPKKRMCDKIIDCLNGEDEMNCEAISTRTLSDLFLENFKLRDTESVFNKTAEFSTAIDSNNSNENKSPLKISTSKDHELENTNSILNEVRKNKTVTETKLKPNVSEFDFFISNSNSSSEESDSLDVSDEFANFHPSIEIHVDNDKIISPALLETTTHGTTTNTISSNIIFDLLENESQPSKVNMKSKEADIQEDWGNTENVLDSTITESTTSSDSVIILNTESIVSTTQSTPVIIHGFSETTTLTQINPSGSIESNIISNNISNENVEVENKELDTLLDRTSKETQDVKRNHSNNRLILHEDKPAKTLSDIEDKQHIIDKIQDILSVGLKPAKIRKKHLSPKEFECRQINQIVPYHLRCDHKPDCEDGSDELGCTCIDYLLTFDQKLICDGFFDCADGQDETDCYSCPEDYFLCKRSQICVPPHLVCDDKPQCPQGEDELDCYALSNGKDVIYDFDERPKVMLQGYITKKRKDKWHVLCEDNLPIEHQEQAANHICHYLGFSSANRYLVKHINVNEGDIVANNFRSKRGTDKNEPIQFEYRASAEETDNARNIVIKNPEVIKEQCLPNVTKTCRSLFVYCDHTLFTDFDFPQGLLFSRVPDYVNVHMWPWVAKVYAEGNYKCTGVLIDLSWVLVSLSCLWDTVFHQNYVTVAMGSHRTFSSATGPYEQVHKVDYKKDLYRSRVLLLHLSEPVHYSNMVKPMIIQSPNVQEEKSQICVAIGQDNYNDTVGVFLEETENNCELHNRCFKRIQNDNICAPGMISQRQWSGIVTCHAEHGWYPAASFVDSRGECGIRDIIIGSDIGNLKSDLRHIVGKSVSESMEQGVAGDCEGVRCGRGRCVKLRKVCDGVRHCEDGNDETEEACRKKHLVCKQDPYQVECDCQAGQLKCHNGHCVPKEVFKDGRDDCGDGTDEPEQTNCSHYLARVIPSRLCDGILHCHDKSDEDPRLCKCYSKRSYKCGRSTNDVEYCVAPDMICDGHSDCPNGEDEKTCMALSAPEGTVYGTGEVIVRSHGVWHSKCYSSTNHTRTELEVICRELGFISGHAKQLTAPGKSIVLPRTKVVLDTFSEVTLNNSTRIKLRNTNSPLAKAIVDNTSENCHPVYIECL